MPSEYNVSKFQVAFVELRCLDHRVIGAPVDIGAATRQEAIDEATRLVPPPRANFVEVLDDGKSTAWLRAVSDGQ